MNRVKHVYNIIKKLSETSPDGDNMYIAYKVLV